METKVFSSLDETFIEELFNESKSWAFANGLVMGTPDGDEAKVTHAPFILIPSSMPRTVFEQAYALAQDFNLLVHRASLDHEFICKALDKVSGADEFTGTLLRLYKEARAGGKKHARALGLHRSDYMLHAQEGGVPLLQQVEINTISAAFPCLSSFVAKMHRYVINKLGGPSSPLRDLSPTSLPENNAGANFAAALAEAWSLYGNDKAVVLMVVQPGEKNAFDQRWIEYFLWENHKVKLIRRTLSDIHARGSLVDGELTIDNVVAAVTYFRAGYTPRDYPTENEWKARLLIENSNTIQCPSLPYHLIGAKKVQQVFALPGVLEKFFDASKEEEAAAIKRLKACFTGLYSLDEGESEDIVKDAIQNPDNYIMKPQREGGGNNLNGEDLKNALLKYSPNERAAFILMQRIRPAPFAAYSCRLGKVSVIQATYELGIYSTFLSDGDKVLVNGAAGHLLRTKEWTNKEGGVVAGASALDSPYLV